MPDDLALHPHVAEAAAKIRATWTRSVRYLRQKAIVTIDGKRQAPEHMAKVI